MGGQRDRFELGCDFEPDSDVLNTTIGGGAELPGCFSESYACTARR
jgi:hypothetical protein